MTPDATPKLTFENLALACVGALFEGQQASGPEADGLHRLFEEFLGKGVEAAIERLQQNADEQDARLLGLKNEFDLTFAELAAVALCAGVDDSLWTARLVAWAQQGSNGARPMAGLLAQALGALAEKKPLTVFGLANGNAFRCGLLTFASEAEALPQRPVAVPLPVALALAGHESHWPGSVEMPDLKACPDGLNVAVGKFANALTGKRPAVLVIRASSVSEGLIAAAVVLGNYVEGGKIALSALLSPDAPLAGLAAWLWLKSAVPVFVFDVPPGEMRLVAEIPEYDGPVLVIAGPDGGISGGTRGELEWGVPLPSAAEREVMWQCGVSGRRASRYLSTLHRLGVVRIAQICELARLDSGRKKGAKVRLHDARVAMRSGGGTNLSAFAQLVPGDVPGNAFIRADSLRVKLMELLARCRLRDGLAEKLGPSAKARYSPGVRALFTGPSGTGKTLAAGWLAMRLGLPLYRVDLAAISSKYIGETERNLARLFAAAEHSAAVLLFDEADSLFGKRTDIRDSTDRFANAQTNYLLQRIETFDGIALLTSNSRAHFDAAFARRLDAIIEFPAPGHAERRDLWRSHAGTALAKEDSEFLAAHADFSGGQIRNVVFAAAVEASGGAVSLSGILRATVAEFRKAGRTPPGEITARLAEMEGKK